MTELGGEDTKGVFQSSFCFGKGGHKATFLWVIFSAQKNYALKKTGTTLGFRFNRKASRANSWRFWVWVILEGRFFKRTIQSKVPKKPLALFQKDLFHSELNFRNILQTGDIASFHLKFAGTGWNSTRSGCIFIKFQVTCLTGRYNTARKWADVDNVRTSQPKKLFDDQPFPP